MMTKKTIITRSLSFFMAIISLVYFAIPTYTPTVAVRTIEIAQSEIDHQSILNSFEEAELYAEDNTTYFTGYQTLAAEMFENFDNVSETDLAEIEGSRIKYHFSYNTEANIVTISAELQNEANEIIVDEISGVGFINSDGNVDAVMNVDGESILLSDMQNVGMIENCGWLSRLIKAATVTVVTAAVVTVVVATAGTGAVAVATIATAATTATAIHVTEKAFALSNKNHNAKNSEPTGYINGQKYYSNWKYGCSTLDYNGCGVIATYNVMKKIGKTKKLKDIIYDFDVRSGSLAIGLFGSDPTHFGTYFSANGVKYSKYYNFSSLQSAMSKMSTGQMALIGAWNGTSAFDGAHYIAVEKTSSGSFRIYNYYSNSTSYVTKSVINKSVTGGNLIIAYIVG